MKTEKIITDDYRHHKALMRLLKNSSKYEIVSEQFIFNDGSSAMGWTMLEKYSDKQIIEYKEI
tara:strand:- start:245 stop:433 length:189 start_codon:yes stop_codon:yes gene_type:complete